MLIYNHKQEFVGINEQDLKKLGFKNLADLKTECSDFADLFDKRPSYIHNFKNFNWIYYILHSDIDEAKVIINARKRSFSATLEVETIYLEDAPTEPAYAISINKLRALDGKALEEIETQTKEQPMASFAPPPPPTPPKPAKKPEPKVEAAPINLPDFGEEEAVELSEPDMFETPTSANVVADPYDFDFNAPLEIEDDIYMPSEESTQFAAPKEETFEFDDKLESPLDIYKEETPAPVKKEEPKATAKDRPMLGDYVHAASNEYIDNLQVSKDYVYNPHVASEELGLPVDLIEEFIGDFIVQSYDFKDKLYENLADEDLSGVKLLSHKLKGVAANLRIEDAFEVLSIINTSDNKDEIKANLDYFYMLIAKLEGKELPVAAPTATPAQQKEVVSPVHEEPEISLDELDDMIGFKDDSVVSKEQKEKPKLQDEDLYDVGLKFDENEPMTVEHHELIKNIDEEAEIPTFHDEPEVEEELLPLVDEDLDTSDFPNIGEPITLEDFDAQQDDFLLKEEAPLETEVEKDVFADIDLAKEEDLEHKDIFSDMNLPDIEDIDHEIAFTDLDPADEKEIEHEEISLESPEDLDIDKEKTADELGLTPEVTNQLFEEFKGQAQSTAQEMQDAVNQDDLHELKNLAMSIKGASDNLRITKLSKVLEEMLHLETIEKAQQLTTSFKNFVNQI